MLVGTAGINTSIYVSYNAKKESSCFRLFGEAHGNTLSATRPCRPATDLISAAEANQRFRLILDGGGIVRVRIEVVILVGRVLNLVPGETSMSEGCSVHNVCSLVGKNVRNCEMLPNVTEIPALPFGFPGTCSPTVEATPVTFVLWFGHIFR